MAAKGFGLRFWSVMAAALMFMGVASSNLHAQIDTGTILGTIKDQTGAVIPHAKVTLTNEGTNFSIVTTSNGSGSYIFTPVQIGTYTVSAEAPGFAKALRTHLKLNIDEQLVANVTLRPGVVTQTVQVTAAPPPLQTQNASVGQVVTGRSVHDLPLNGRNYTFLAQIVAGVNTPQADTRGNAATGAFSANGLRPAQNNYLLNGIDDNEDTVDFLNGTNFVVLPPVDAISEFKVQTSDFSAQYGRAGGAILNATIKSGTNQLHGDLWEFFRNDKLDAADFFEDAGGIHKGEYRQNQFGFTIGGPVVIPHVYNGKNKLFFFGDYEGLRRRQGSVFTNSVPTALERSSGFTNFADLILGQKGSAVETDALGRMFPAGTILDPATTRPVGCGVSDPVTGIAGPPCPSGTPTGTTVGYVRDPFFTGGSIAGVTNFTGDCPSEAACMLNQLPAGRLDPNAIKILDLYPAPNGTSLFGSNYTDSPVLSENRNSFDTRIDWDKSEKDQMFGTFSYVNDPQLIPGPFKGVADGGAFEQGNQQALSIQGALSYTHIFSPTLVNEARLGENRIHTSRYGPVATQFGIPAQYGISSSIPQCCENGGLPAFGISGLNTLGSNAFLPSNEISQTTQLMDNLTKVYGNHTFKMGIEFQHVKYSTLQPPWSHGQYNYDGVYTGIPDGATGSTGPAQFLLTPIKSTVPNGINYLGGTDAVFTSNISLTDDLKNYYGAYFQDDWKTTSKLTLNLGVRWDYFGQTHEHFGAQANFIPGPPGNGAEYLIPANRDTGLSPSFLALTAQDGIKIVPSNNPNLGLSQWTNFSPRLGFAYRATRKLVLRGGYGIFYNGFENRGYSPNIGENYPFQFNFSFFNPNGETPIGASAFPSFAGTPCANAFTFETGFDCTPLKATLVQASGLALRGIQYNYITPYTQGWNLTAEYELTPSTTLTVAYVGNTVHHLESFPGSNEVSKILPTGTNIHATSAPGKGLYLPYPDFGNGSSYAATEGDSYYNGLQTTLEKHYANGMDFLANYTYSNARSDAGDLLNGGTGGGYRCPYCAGFGIQGDYQNAIYSIRNVFHFSGSYQLPFGSGRRFMAHAKGVANEVVSGWSANWIATVEGGQPLNIRCARGTTAGTGCDALLTGQNPYAGPHNVNQWLNPAAFTQPCVLGATGPILGDPTGCAPLTGLAAMGGAPSQVVGPGISRLDFSLFKDFRLSERYRLQFRSEFFNILNHPTFNAPGFGGNGVVAIPGSTDFTNKNFGKIGSTRFPFQDPRQIQFALKLFF